MLKLTNNYFIIISILLFSLIFSIIISYNSTKLSGIPILVICLLLIFFIHLIIFLPSFIFKTEKYFDITGTVTFLCCIIISISSIYYIENENISLRSIILSTIISLWTIRLGTFLLLRIIKEGKDKRFTEIKKSFSSFLLTWTMSSLWVFLTSMNALTSIINNKIINNDFFLHIGLSVWVIGFLIESIADFQKNNFRKKYKNKFISSGLWKYSRHPNYFGEIILWIGISIITYPTLDGLQNLTLITPFLIYLLLTKISGINLLEEKAEQEWGNDPSYIKYKNNTPQLIPFFLKK